MLKKFEKVVLFIDNLSAPAVIHLSLVIFALALFLRLEGYWALGAFLIPYLIVGYDVIFSAVRNLIKGQILDENFFMSIAYQNIIFALAVKAIVLILGALGFANMWLAVFADVGVSVIAILNAMRALGKRNK